MENNEFIINFSDPHTFSVKLSDVHFVENEDGSADIKFEYTMLEGEAPPNLEQLLEETIILAIEQSMEKHAELAQR